MSQVELVGEQRVVLRSVRWETYLALVAESEQAGGRMTYDRGVLEIMSPSMVHEHAGSLLARMIEMFTFLKNVEIRTAASTTFRRDDLRRGFEADESYYIANASKVRHRREIDLNVDPPPDLVLEVDITNSSIDKLQLFASMGIPEVWRFNGSVLWMGQLAGEDYKTLVESHVLPEFPSELAGELLSQQFTTSETELIHRFANFVQSGDRQC